MSFKVKELVEEKEGYFEVDPAVMFPATIKRIQEVLAGEAPTEIVSKDWKGSPYRDPVVDRFMREAESYDDEAWESALIPYHVVFEHERETRAKVLAFVESWFNRALALEEGKGIRVHISKNLDWRR